MFLSVIIPTRNRASLLEKLLRSIIEQTINPSMYEVLVIDNGSTDNTQNAVAHFLPVISNLRYFYEPNPGLHSGRHRGFLEAQGDVLVYADDDIEALPSWLETIYQCFQEPDVVMVGGKNLPRFESTPPVWIQEMWKPDLAGNKILAYLSILDLGIQPKSISPFLIFGCNFSVRRLVLKEAEGFHPDGMPKNLIQYRGDGESHVSQYISSRNYKAFYHPDASVYHWVSNNRMTIEYFCRRAYNQGISDSYTQLRQINGLAIQKNSNYKTFSREFLILIVTMRSLFHQSYRGIVGRRSSKKIRKLYSSFRRILSYFNSDFLQKDEFEEIQTQLNESYQAGYAFHQHLVENDPTLLAWVIKPNYWDCCLPKAISSNM